jgi:hypothetical protein
MVAKSTNASVNLPPSTVTALIYIVSGGGMPIPPDNFA